MAREANRIEDLTVRKTREKHAQKLSDLDQRRQIRFIHLSTSAFTNAGQPGGGQGGVKATREGGIYTKR